MSRNISSDLLDTIQDNNALSQSRVIDIAKMELYSKLLNRSDRLLMRLMLEGNNTHAQIASRLNISQAALSFRIHRLTKLLGGGFSVFSISLKPHEQRIARLFFFKGRTLRQITRDTDLSMYRVRQVFSALKTNSPRSIS